jgi:hypothetical protein
MYALFLLAEYILHFKLYGYVTKFYKPELIL